VFFASPPDPDPSARGGSSDWLFPGPATADELALPCRLVLLPVFPLYCAFVARFWPESIGFEPWLRWMPLGFGLLLACGYFVALRWSDAAVYRVLGIASLVLGVAATFLNQLAPALPPDTGLLWMLAVMGITSMIWGTVSLARFLKKYPLDKESSAGEANHEA